MASWSMHSDFAPPFALNVSTRDLKHVGVAILGAAVVVTALWLLPLSLFLPALSIMSFVIACGSALFAHWFRVDHRGPGVTAWDVALVFTFIWIGAAMISGPGPVIHAFSRLMTPS